MKYLSLVALALFVVACQPEAPTYNGYVEGEYLYIAPTTAGLLGSLDVARGQAVHAGETLFTLDQTDLKATLAGAEAEVDQARANWKNMTKGLREDEIDVILRQQDQAKANLESADKEFKRVQGLIASGASSRADYDIKKAAFESAQAHVAEVESQIKTAKLGGRDDERAAALAAIQVAEEKVTQAQKRLTDSAPTAPTDGRIEDTYYHKGEYIGAGTPVVSLLPPENVKIRFFVPEAALARFPLGSAITLHCDGCGKPIPAKINFIATQSEYTPPVIYSVESRDKLVFRIEAVPVSFSPELRPGLPVDIERAAP